MCLYKCVDYLTACDGCDILGPLPLFKMTSKMAAKIWKSMLIQNMAQFYNNYTNFDDAHHI